MGFYINGIDASGGDSSSSTPSTSAGVSSFNNRTGAVTPQDGDYTAAQVGALSTAGGALTGVLTLSQDPTLPLQAATKRYVDDSITTAIANIDTSGSDITLISQLTNDKDYVTRTEMNQAILEAVQEALNASLGASY